MNPHPYPSEQGASTVEFAASMIVLFTLIFGTVAVSMAYYTYEVLNQYARDASRYAIVHGNGCSYDLKGTTTSCSIATSCTGINGIYSCAGANSALKTYLNNQIFPGINGNNITVTTVYTHAPGLTSCIATDCNGAGDQVTVNISYQYLYAVPFVPSNLITMRAHSTMVISQ